MHIPYTYVCTIQWDLLNCLTEWGPGTPTMAVSHWRGCEYDNCSVNKARCLRSLNLMLKAWKISVLISVNECCSNRIDELTCQWEWWQVNESKAFLFYVFLFGLPSEVFTQIQGYLSDLNNMIKKFPHVSSYPDQIKLTTQICYHKVIWLICE